MDTESILESIQDTLSSLFRKGSRHQVEKIATMVGFVLLSVTSVIWGLSGKDPNNALGAAFGPETIEAIDSSIFFLENNSGEDWSNVRVVLNRRYLYTSKEHAAGKRATLGPKDFLYFYYIPRPWGLGDWERLGKNKKPGARAPDTLTAKYVQIRSDQGRIDIDLKNMPKKAQ